MLRLHRALIAATLSGILTGGCEPGTVTAPQGEVRGVVLVEGASQAGVIVELTGPQVRSVTTDEAGRYTFQQVPSGAYVVSVRSIPIDASFPATSRTAVVSGAQTVTVDFLGTYIRTASIEGSVTSGSQGLAGVVVTLEGAQSGTTLTGVGGSFVFSGLRAGQYQVTISGFPQSVSFPSVRTDVALSTGQTFLVTFAGVPELTASVVIRSIARRLPDGTIEPADPQNLRGLLEVTATVDRGEDTLSSLDLLLAGEVVGRQTFDPAAGAPGADPPPQRQAPLDIVFSFDTAEFDESTGAVRFANGQALLTARLATAEGGPSAWLSSVQVQLRNVDTFTGSLVPEVGPIPGEFDGQDWVGGAQVLSVVPVLYDASRAVQSVTVDLRRTGGSQLRSKTMSGTAPFDVRLEATGAPGSSNVAGYQTPAGATDQLRVLSARYEDGGAVPGVPVVLAEELRIDNVGPAAADFALPRQGPSRDCCLSNWVGAGFAFQAAVKLGLDAGVGGVSATVHAGDADLTDSELAELAAVAVGADLDPTSGNGSLRAVAVSRDALGNAISSALAPSDGNSLSNPLGAVLGVDLEPPQLTFDPASVPDRAKNPGPGSAWILSVSDGASGAAPSAARTTVRLLNPMVLGTPAQCVFPATEDCQPAVDGLVRSVPDGLEGYLRYESQVLDRAGNASSPVERMVLRDVTRPDIVSIQVPGTLIPATQTTFSAVAQDNLDLHQGWIALEFGGGGGGGAEVVPAQAPQVLGVPFDDDLTTTASLVQTFPLVSGLERVVSGQQGSAPTGTVLALAAARGVSTDAAGGLTSRSEPLPGAGTLPKRSFSEAERGPGGGVRDWALVSDTERVCRADRRDDCASGVASSVRLTATARGEGGVLARPFDRVYVYALRSGEPEWIGVTVASEMQDGAGPLGRAWLWRLPWTPPSTFPLGPVTLVSVGVDAEGNGLRTLGLSSVVIEGGP